MLKIKSQPMALQKQSPSSQEIEGKVRSAAEMYEKHFLREMVKAMRKTVSHGGLVKKNMAEKIFSEKLDGEYVDVWGKKGGIGLSDVIYEQVMQRFGQQMGVRGKSVARPQGPINLKESSMTVLPQSQSSTKALEFKVKKLQKTQEVKEVLSPWSGMLVDARRLESGHVLGRVEHDQGLVSELIFKGSLADSRPGDMLRSGQTIGLLGPEAEGFFWRVRDREF